MTNILAFATQDKAEAADALITAAHNFSDHGTKRWDTPRQIPDKRWSIAKPEDRYMTGVTGYTVVTYDPSWFTSAMLP
jgi:hypothetical protein